MEPVEQDWKVSCSDDEGYGRIDSSNPSWEPPVKQIALLYQQLEEEWIPGLEMAVSGEKISFCSLNVWSDSRQEQDIEHD